MKVGFTGTRKGLTETQRFVFKSALAMYRPTEFHHGDCVGADAQAVEIVRELFPECAVHSHPCDIRPLRAHTKADFVHKVKRPLVRNRDIVKACAILIACPKEKEEPKSKRAGGTWMTARYAKKIGRRYRVIEGDE